MTINHDAINAREGSLVLLCTFSNDVEAHLAKALLDDNGIVTILDNEMFSRIYPIGFNSIGGIRMMGDSRQAAQAVELLSTLSFVD